MSSRGSASRVLILARSRTSRWSWVSMKFRYQLARREGERAARPDSRRPQSAPVPQPRRSSREVVEDSLGIPPCISPRCSRRISIRSAKDRKGSVPAGLGTNRRNRPGERLRSISCFKAVKRVGTRCTSSRTVRSPKPPTKPAGSDSAALRASSKLM